MSKKEVKSGIHKVKVVVARSWAEELFVIDVDRGYEGAFQGIECDSAHQYFDNYDVIPKKPGLYLVKCEQNYDNGDCTITKVDLLYATAL